MIVTVSKNVTTSTHSIDRDESFNIRLIWSDADTIKNYLGFEFHNGETKTLQREDFIFNRCDFGTGVHHDSVESLLGLDFNPYEAMYT